MTKSNACATLRASPRAGIAKGKDNATAMNSSAASICYVASTHQVFPGLITHQTAETNAPSEPPDDSARPVRPDPSADAPEPSEPAPDDSHNTPSRRETATSGSRDYARRSWHDNAAWDNSTYSRRDRRSSPEHRLLITIKRFDFEA